MVGDGVKVEREGERGREGGESGGSGLGFRLKRKETKGGYVRGKNFLIFFLDNKIVE